MIKKLNKQHILFAEAVASGSNLTQSYLYATGKISAPNTPLRNLHAQTAWQWSREQLVIEEIDRIILETRHQSKKLRDETYNIALKSIKQRLQDIDNVPDNDFQWVKRTQVLLNAAAIFTPKETIDKEPENAVLEVDDELQA
jgi:hypothetical protein